MPTKTSEMSHSGRTDAAMSENTMRDAVRRRVRFFIETPAIFIVSNVELRLTLTALAHLLRGRVNLAELNELIVCLSADLGNKRALMSDVLGAGALKVAAVAHLTH